MTKSYPNISQSLGITGIAILFLILFNLVNAVLYRFLGREVSSLICQVLSIGLPFWIFYSVRKRKTNLSSFNLSINNKRIIPLLIIGTIALSIGVIAPISKLIPVPEILKKVFMTNHTGFFAFFSAVIVAPIFEELIFRGLILDGLLKKYAPIKSILISSLLFGLLHLNPWQFIAGFTIGFFLGWIYYKTQSLMFPVIMHGANNLFAFSMGYFYDLELSMNLTWKETYGELTNMIIVIIAIVTFTICIYILQKEFKRYNVKTLNKSSV